MFGACTGIKSLTQCLAQLLQHTLGTTMWLVLANQTACVYIILSLQCVCYKYIDRQYHCQYEDPLVRHPLQ